MMLIFSFLEFARQLTLSEYDIFRRIKPSELFQKAWDHPHRAPAISALINRFNTVPAAFPGTMPPLSRSLSVHELSLDKLLGCA